MTVLSISLVGPHDFELCLRIARSFSPDPFPDSPVLRSAVGIQDHLPVLERRQVRRAPPVSEVRADLRDRASELKQVARWITFAELDLRPFYRLAASHSVLGPIIKALHGLKPMRPVSLFEMLVTAITEQQISLAAAYRIRTRIIERLGDPIDGLWAFPSPGRFCEHSVADLVACGLSQRKAEYVKGVADKVAAGLLHLDQLAERSDEEVRSLLLQVRGLGPWSAEYFLVRGLGRPDRVPASDIGIRSVAGRYLGTGRRLSPEETMKKLSPFRPYRGLAAFYLLAWGRLEKALANDR